MIRILVTGSRDWIERAPIEKALRDALWRLTGDSPVLVHGGARGADAIAHHVWQEWRSLGEPYLRPEVHRADWSTWGNAAGPIRNVEMVRLGASICLAFPLGQSTGTRHCMRTAQAAGIPVINYGDDLHV